MSPEEFLAHINNSEETEKHYAKLYKAFSQKLPEGLTEVVFAHMPGMKEKRDTLYDDVYKIAGKYVGEIWEWYNQTESSNYFKLKVEGISPVPKPKTREEAEKELQSELKGVPDEHHEMYKKAHWEAYELDNPHEVFVYAVYNKMKEVFVEFYMDDILNLDSDYLRMFDEEIYLMCATEFVYNVYGL